MIYSFICEDHGVFDKNVSLHEDNIHIQPCPECDKDSRRKYQATVTLFKGTGFYVTDTAGAKRSTVS